MILKCQCLSVSKITIQKHAHGLINKRKTKRRIGNGAPSMPVMPRRRPSSSLIPAYPFKQKDVSGKVRSGLQIRHWERRARRRGTIKRYYWTGRRVFATGPVKAPTARPSDTLLRKCPSFYRFQVIFMRDRSTECLSYTTMSFKRMCSPCSKIFTH